MNYNNNIILASQACSGSFNSDAQALLKANDFSVQCVTDGAPNGTVKLQCSVDYASYPAPSDPDWSDIGGASSTISASGNVVFNLYSQNYPYFRVVWTDSSSDSTSTMTITSFVKENY